MTESQFALLAYMRVLSHICCKNLLKLLLHLYIIIKKTPLARSSPPMRKVIRINFYLNSFVIL